MAIQYIAFKVHGMTCDHCAGSISKAVGLLNGVVNVKVDLPTRKVMVEFDPELVSEDIIKDTVADQGYEVR